MGWLAAIGLVAAFLTFHFLFRTMRCVRRRHLVRAGGSSVSCLVFATLTSAAGMLLLSYMSYERLIEEKVVSQVAFRKVSPQEFQARLMIPGQDDQFFILRGDEWQIDARIVSWKPPVTILGLDPIYQLDRLSGRYGDIDREQNEARTVHSLLNELPTDIWRLARQFPIAIPGIDAHYGTATYVPMVDGARFEVSLSRDALIARPANQVAREAVGEWRVPEE
jgi:hypothetical protein